jgi:hypothetical protein
MKQKPRSRVNRKKAKTVLRLPDLEHAKAAVLNSLTSVDAQRYRHAIDEFVDWYCSEPRLAFNRIVVLRYRRYLESRQLAQIFLSYWTHLRFRASHGQPAPHPSLAVRARNGRVADHPPGTRTNGSSMRALDFLQHLRTALLDLPVVTALASVPLPIRRLPKSKVAQRSSLALVSTFSRIVGSGNIRAISIVPTIVEKMEKKAHTCPNSHAA